MDCLPAEPLPIRTASPAGTVAAPNEAALDFVMLSAALRVSQDIINHFVGR